MKKNKKITLVCNECYSRNYSLKQSDSGSQQKLEVKKYCPKCNKHTSHKGNR